MLTSLDSIEQKIKGFDVGADDYIVKPFEPREFLARVAILLKRSEIAKLTPDSGDANGKTIAVFSLRGGAGVSTIAANVAIGLSQIWNQSIALVDMVMIGGQSALYLNQSLKNTWADIAGFPMNEIDDNLIQSILLPHESGVYTLASPRRPEHAELVTDEKVNLVLTSLKKNHEYLILDLPHNFNSTTLAALDIADVILVVLQPEIISVRSAALIIETFGNLGFDLNKVNFILNWTFPRKGISIVEIEKLIQKKISLTIPYASDEFLHALNYGLPPMYDTPEEPIGILFEDLAMSLSKEKHRKNRPENPTQAWIRVIKRLKKRKTQI
jgi:pilus assembly protein CpaE